MYSGSMPAAQGAAMGRDPSPAGTRGRGSREIVSETSFAVVLGRQSASRGLQHDVGPRRGEAAERIRETGRASRPRGGRAAQGDAGDVAIAVPEPVGTPALGPDPAEDDARDTEVTRSASVGLSTRQSGGVPSDESLSVPSGADHPGMEAATRPASAVNSVEVGNADDGINFARGAGEVSGASGPVDGAPGHDGASSFREGFVVAETAPEAWTAARLDDDGLLLSPHEYAERAELLGLPHGRRAVPERGAGDAAARSSATTGGGSVIRKTVSTSMSGTNTSSTIGSLFTEQSTGSESTYSRVGMHEEATVGSVAAPEVDADASTGSDTAAAAEVETDEEIEARAAIEGADERPAGVGPNADTEDSGRSDATTAVVDNTKLDGMADGRTVDARRAAPPAGFSRLSGSLDGEFTSIRVSSMARSVAESAAGTSAATDSPLAPRGEGTGAAIGYGIASQTPGAAGIMRPGPGDASNDGGLLQEGGLGPHSSGMTMDRRIDGGDEGIGAELSGHSAAEVDESDWAPHLAVQAHRPGGGTPRGPVGARAFADDRTDASTGKATDVAVTTPVSSAAGTSYSGQGGFGQDGGYSYAYGALAGLNGDSVGASSPGAGVFEASHVFDQIASPLEDIVAELVRAPVGDDNTEQVSIRLRPEFLGEVVMRISVDSDGVVTARFMAEHAFVRTMIEQQLPELRASLAEHGLVLGDTSVAGGDAGLAGRDGAGTAYEAPSGAETSGRTYDAGSYGEMDEDIVEMFASTTAGGIDIRI